ncbi:M23 family metallopeptidase [Candidatus Woesearchaeota archaeon]|nr:M23 family metallopeptidase [Candidatus Woesearchaeota archaeon]
MFRRRDFINLVGVSAVLLGFSRLASALTKPKFEIFNEEPAIKVKVRRWERENYTYISELYTENKNNANEIKAFNEKNLNKKFLFLPKRLLRKVLNNTIEEDKYTIYKLGAQGENGINDLDDIAKDFMNDSYGLDDKLAVLLVINDIDPKNKELKEGDLVIVPRFFVDFNIEEKPSPYEFDIVPKLSDNFQNPLKIKSADSIIKNLKRRYVYGARRLRGDDEEGKFFIISRHLGIDIPMPVGFALYPIQDGKFIYGGKDNDKPGNGIRVTYKTKDGLIVTYLHLSWVNNKLSLGSEINKNTILGKVGTTGNVEKDDPHVHVQITFNGKNVNPSPYILVDTRDYVLDLDRQFFKR